MFWFFPSWTIPNQPVGFRYSYRCAKSSGRLISKHNSVNNAFPETGKNLPFSRAPAMAATSYRILKHDAASVSVIESAIRSFLTTDQIQRNFYETQKNGFACLAPVPGRLRQLARFPHVTHVHDEENILPSGMA